MPSRTRKSRRRITAEDLLRFHWVGDPQISPDGRSIVFVKKHVGDKNQYVRDLWMVATDDGAVPTRFTSGAFDAHPRWSPDGNAIAFLSAREKQPPQIWTIPVAGGEATVLTRFEEGTVGDFAWSPDGRSIAVAFRKRGAEWTREASKERETKGLSTPPLVIDDWWYRLDGDGYFGSDRFGLFVVDVATGDHRLLFNRDVTGMFSFDWSPDGTEIAIAANLDKRGLIRPWKTQILRVNVKSGKARVVPDVPEGPKDGLRWSPDGKTFAWAGRLGESDSYGTANLELFVCNAEGGGARSLSGREDYCLLAVAISDSTEATFAPSLRFTPDSRRILFKLGWHGETHIASVKRSGGTIKLHTSGAAEHDLGNVSRDGRLIATVVGASTTLGEVHVASDSEGVLALRRLTAFNTELLAELELSRPRAHWVSSTGGAKVQVWEMKALARRKGRGPAVLEIHGGPHAQYGVGFFHELQLLAASGYHVFYSNPRGSKGYGQQHCAAIHGNWGSVDWDDIDAVTDFIASRDHVNSDQIGIMGGSYGGYMTNWAIGHSPKYRAAITDRCVSNLVSMGGNSDFPTDPDRYWSGNTWDRTETLWSQSPLRYFGNVRTPTLIIHSEGDLRCNIEQSEQVFHALKVRNIPTRFIRYPASTSHGMSRSGPPDLRIHRLTAILEWWKRYLKS